MSKAPVKTENFIHRFIGTPALNVFDCNPTKVPVVYLLRHTLARRIIHWLGACGVSFSMAGNGVGVV